MRIKRLTAGPLGDFCGLKVSFGNWMTFLGSYQSTKILVCIKCACHFPRVTRYVKMIVV